MALFFNHRSPKPFRYTPRHYDPVKDARMERKRRSAAEGCADSGNVEKTEGSNDYIPGSILRSTARDRRKVAPQSRFVHRRRRKTRGVTSLLIMSFLLILIVWLLYVRG